MDTRFLQVRRGYNNNNSDSGLSCNFDSDCPDDEVCQSGSCGKESNAVASILFSILSMICCCICIAAIITYIRRRRQQNMRRDSRISNTQVVQVNRHGRVISQGPQPIGSGRGRGGSNGVLNTFSGQGQMIGGGGDSVLVMHNRRTGQTAMIVMEDSESTNV